MVIHRLALAGIKGARFVEDGILDPELTQIMQQGRQYHSFPFGLLQMGKRGQQGRHGADPQRVAVGKTALAIDYPGKHACQLQQGTKLHDLRRPLVHPLLIEELQRLLIQGKPETLVIRGTEEDLHQIRRK